MMAAGEEGYSGSDFSSGEGKALDKVSRELTEKLRRAERETTEIEEQLEADTASWKREWRQLSDEIEKSRQSLVRGAVEVRESEEIGRRLTEGLEHRLDETTRYGRELELKCEQQSLEYASDRKTLQSRIEILEKQIVEWIERSHNSGRSEQSMDRKMEAELASQKQAFQIEFQKNLRGEQVKWNTAQRGLEDEIEGLRKQLTVASASKFSLIWRFFGSRR